MSGRTLGAIAGAAIGYMIPGIGIALGMQLGSLAGGLLMPDELGLQDQFGPRLSSLSVTNAIYGVSIKRIYGSYRVGGNVIWSEPIKEASHEREIEVGKGGSESYTYTWYTYSVSFAVAMCEGPINNINKIWADSIKIYDATEDGYTQAFLTSEETSGDIDIYLGGADQSIDWILQAENEDTPAYRHVAYIRFHNFQLEKFGNRVPNITCEVNKGPTETGVIAESNAMIEDNADEILVASTSTVKFFSGNTTDGSNSVTSYERLDTETAVENFSIDIPVEEISSSWSIHSNYNSDITSILTRHEIKEGIEVVGWNYTITDNLKNQMSFTTLIDHSNDIIWYLNNSIYIYYISNNTIEYISELSSEGPPIYYTDLPLETVSVDIRDATLYAVVTSGRLLYVYDLHSKEQLNTIPIHTDIDIVSDMLIFPDGNNYHIFDGTKLHYISHDGSYIRIVIEDNIEYANRGLYVENGMAKVLYNQFYDLTTGWHYNTFGSWVLYSNIGVLLSVIIKDLLNISNILDTEMDVVAADAILVLGFAIPNVSSARASLAVLQSIYLFDLYEDSNKLIVKLRGASSSTNIDTYVLNDNNKEEVNIVRRLDTEMPKKITIAYSNADIDYQIGSQATIRIDGNSDNNINLEAALVLVDSEAKQLAEKLMYTTWSGKTFINFTIPLDSNLTVSQIVTVVLENVTYTVRIIKITITTNYMCQCETVTEDQDVYISNAVADSTSLGFIPTISDRAGPTIFEVFNAPTLDNSVLNNPGVYIVAAGHIATRWRGCEIYKSKDGGINYNTQGAILESTKFGTALSVLQPGPTTYWDLNNSVNVTISSDLVNLPSVSNEVLLSGKENYILIGNEVLQYGIAVAELDGTYTLSNLLRGRRGTEWAIDTHEIDELFVLLDFSIMFNASTLNAFRYYKAVTVGYYLSSAISKTHTYNGANRITFSPSMVNHKNEENGDKTITWMRRDRYISGFFSTLPISETQESYKLEFLYGIISKRIEYITTSTEYLYTVAEQTSDGDVDRIHVSQYSDGLSDFGYITEELI